MLSYRISAQRFYTAKQLAVKLLDLHPTQSKPKNSSKQQINPYLEFSDF